MNAMDIMFGETEQTNVYHKKGDGKHRYKDIIRDEEGIDYNHQH